jgi:hypothetical protein
MDIFHLKFIHLALPNFKIKLIISIVLLNNIRATIALGLEGDANQSPAGIQVQVLKVPAALLLATVAGAYCTRTSTWTIAADPAPGTNGCDTVRQYVHVDECNIC